MQRVVSEFDLVIYRKIRDNVSRFIEQNAEELDSSAIKILDIAPQDHTGAKQSFIEAQVSTEDIDEKSVPIIIIDICMNKRTKLPKTVEMIVRTQVIERP